MKSVVQPERIVAAYVMQSILLFISAILVLLSNIIDSPIIPQINFTLPIFMTIAAYLLYSFLKKNQQPNFKYSQLSISMSALSMALIILLIFVLYEPIGNDMRRILYLLGMLGISLFSLSGVLWSFSLSNYGSELKAFFSTWPFLISLLTRGELSDSTYFVVLIISSIYLLTCGIWISSEIKPRNTGFGDIMKMIDKRLNWNAFKSEKKYPVLLGIIALAMTITPSVIFLLFLPPILTVPVFLGLGAILRSIIYIKKDTDEKDIRYAYAGMILGILSMISFVYWLVDFQSQMFT